MNPELALLQIVTEDGSGRPSLGAAYRQLRRDIIEAFIALATSCAWST